MKVVFVLFLASSFAALSVAAWSAEDRSYFQKWVKQYGKVYQSHAEEKEAMENVLKARDHVEAHNRLYNQGKVSYEKGMNEHSDLSSQQMRRKLLGVQYPADERNDRSKRAPSKKLEGFGSTAPIPDYPEGPDSIDWRDHGLVGPVRNQGEMLFAN